MQDHRLAGRSTRGHQGRGGRRKRQKESAAQSLYCRFCGREWVRQVGLSKLRIG